LLFNEIISNNNFQEKSEPNSNQDVNIPIKIGTNSSASFSTQNKGIRVALIAFTINMFFTLLIVNTFGVFASGIFLGISKEKGKRTNLVFFILSFFSFLILDIAKGPTIYEDKAKQGFVLIFSNILMAIIPLGICSIIKKIFKR